MRIICGFWCVLLLLFAFVQYNDPDFLFWGVIYFVGAVFCAIAALRPILFKRKVIYFALIALTVASLVGVFWFWPQTPGWWRQEVWWETETAREGMGMMIIFIFLLSSWFVARKHYGRP